MRRATLAALAAVVLLAAIVLVRAARPEAPAPLAAAAPAPPVRIDAESVARRLGGGLQFATITWREPERLDAEAFDGFRRYLESTYPRLHEALERESVAGHSLLYAWRGSDASAAPLLLAAHQDVVPVDEGAWSEPPFSGAVLGGEVWGRGAVDDKGALFCILEAVDTLLAEGWHPRRTVYLAFGHDEERGGELGAKQVAALLASRGVALESVLDEGGAVVEGFPGVVSRPIAVVGIAEKGSVSVVLRVEAEGGHSSVPPRHSAVGILASAVHRLERQPMPARLTPTTRGFVDALSPQLPFRARLVTENLWLFGPLLMPFAADVPPLNAMLRTTTAATVFHGGTKPNVLPRHVEAVVNFRILPGDTVQDVLDHVRRTVDDERIEISTTENPRNPSAVSPVDSEAWRRLARAIALHFPGTHPVPYLVVGGTDARHYGRLTPNVYRFSPFRFSEETRERFHGVDERLPVDALPTAIGFYRQLLLDGA